MTALRLDKIQVRAILCAEIRRKVINDNFRAPAGFFTHGGQFGLPDVAFRLYVSDITSLRQCFRHSYTVQLSFACLKRMSSMRLNSERAGTSRDGGYYHAKTTSKQVFHLPTVLHRTSWPTS